MKLISVLQLNSCHDFQCRLLRRLLLHHSTPVWMLQLLCADTTCSYVILRRGRFFLFQIREIISNVDKRADDLCHRRWGRGGSFSSQKEVCQRISLFQTFRPVFGVKHVAKHSVGSLFRVFLNELISYEKQQFINFIIRASPSQRDVTLMRMRGVWSLRQPRIS